MSFFRRKKLVARLEAPKPGTASLLAHHHTRKERAGAWSTVVFVIIVLTICVSPNLFRKFPTAGVGSAWPHHDLVSPYKIILPDTLAAESQRKRLEGDHIKVFTVDSRLAKDIGLKTSKLVAFLNDRGTSMSAPALKKEVRKRFGLDLQRDTLDTLSDHAAARRTLSDLHIIFHHLLQVRGVSADKSLLNSALRSDRAQVVSADEQGVTSPTLRMVLAYPDEAFSFAENSYLQTFQISPEMNAAYTDLIRQMLQPNIIYSPDRTEQKLRKSLASVNPQIVFNPGSVLIHTGDTVTPETLNALALIDKQETRNDLLRMLGGFIIVMLSVTFTGLYARRYNSGLGFNSRSVLLVALPVVFAVSLGRVILNLDGGMFLGAFAMPAGMVGILTVMLFDERFAIVLTTMACALFATSTGLNFPYTIMGLVGGFTAIASLRNLRERREVLYTGLYIAVANCLIALAIGLIMNPSRADLSAAFTAAVVNGIVCYMLAVAILPLFENLFQVTTDVRLLELTGANNKLLQQMEEKAPGTLHHSMNVASLAETAAEAVGAHYLLVRAGAYFHDIGKMIKPTYFTENQSTPEQKQVHSKLSPAMSTLIIKNHVKEGVELARAARLPERVIDFIPEHHGTTLIKYFYVQALKKAEQDGSDEIISEDEYRYPGPNPRSIETAILMLADSVEAISTSRFSGKNPDEVEIRRAVHEAVNDKYEDRQLSNSPLTFKDLEIIKEAFVRVLQNRFHQRIKYPTMPGKGPASTGDKGAHPRKASDSGKKADSSASSNTAGSSEQRSSKTKLVSEKK